MVIASKINFKATTSTNTDNKTEFPPENEWKNKYMIGSHSSHRTATFSVIIWCWQIHIVVLACCCCCCLQKKKEKKEMTHLAKMLQLQPNFDFDWDDTGWHWSRSFPDYYPSTKLSWTQQFPALIIRPMHGRFVWLPACSPLISCTCSLIMFPY